MCNHHIIKIIMAVAAASVISACVEKHSAYQSSPQSHADMAAAPSSTGFYNPHAAHPSVPATGFYMGAPPVKGRGNQSVPPPPSSENIAQTPTPVPAAGEPVANATDAASPSSDVSAPAKAASPSSGTPAAPAPVAASTPVSPAAAS